MCSKSICEFFDPFYSRLPMLGDNISGTELVGKLLAFRMAAHCNDPLCP
jgi:hypothetical protein